jgi:hypothetical protein
MSKMICQYGQFFFFFFGALRFGIEGKNLLHKEIGYNMSRLHECKEQHIGPGLKCALNSSGDEGEAGCA